MSSFEGIKGAALLGSKDDKQKALDQMAIKLIVGRQITCPVTGMVLDLARAVVVEINGDDGSQAYTSACRADYFESNPGLLEKITELAEDEGASIRVLDGRELF